MKGIAIIVAAGKGERAGVDKIWMKLGNETTLERAVGPFSDSATVDEIFEATAVKRYFTSQMLELVQEEEELLEEEDLF